MVDIRPGDSTWPEQAQVAIAELQRSLSGVFEAIEHIGSTSVPGLAAKPIIDLMASVRTLSIVWESSLAGLGYRPLDTGMPDRLFFYRDTAGRRSHHLHVVATENWMTRNERLLRDHLLTHPDAARAYGDLKCRLAAQGLADEDYTRAKTALIQELVDSARDARGLPRVAVWEG